MQKRRTQFLLVLFWGNVQPCGLFLLKSHRTICYQNCFQKNILIVITNSIHYIDRKKKKSLWKWWRKLMRQHNFLQLICHAHTFLSNQPTLWSVSILGDFFGIMITCPLGSFSIVHTTYTSTIQYFGNFLCIFPYLSTTRQIGWLFT